MDRNDTRAALKASLKRWQDGNARENDSAVEASLRHVEAFALASLAQELHEIALTLQARHEEAIEGGGWFAKARTRGNALQDAAQELERLGGRAPAERARRALGDDHAR